MSARRAIACLKYRTGRTIKEAPSEDKKDTRDGIIDFALTEFESFGYKDTRDADED